MHKRIKQSITAAGEDVKPIVLPSSQTIAKPLVSCRTIPLEDNIVIVVDNSNYKAEYAEKVPFRAKVLDKYENEIILMFH